MKNTESKLHPSGELRREITKLRAEIEALTNRVPVSHDRTYLMQRLKDLKKRAASGEDLRHRETSGSVVISASMSLAAGAEFNKLSEREGGTSQLVKNALLCWANENGHKALSKALGAA